MPGHDIIVIGASAGGVEALLTIARALPEDLPAAVFVVLHISPYARSVLPELLSRTGPLPAVHARNGETIQPGRIYVAPPDHHLLVRREGVSVTRGPQENGVRPAVDVLFRTAATAFRKRVVGVVLSGNLDDGTAGLAAIHRFGGVTVVQHPDEALYPGMPTNAVENVPVQYIRPLAEIAPLLVKLAREPVEEPVPAPFPSDGHDGELEMEANVSNMDPAAIHDRKRPGQPSVFGCPDCHGTLFELHDSELTRFRCRVGHAYSPESLLAAQSDGIEAALWTALRALEEKVALTERMLQRMRARGHRASLAHFERQSQDTQQQAEVLRQLLVHNNGGGGGGTIPGDSSAGAPPPRVPTKL